MEKQVYLYVAKKTDSDLYKIGISVHPERRMKQLSTPNVFEVKLLHTIPVDAARRTEAYLKRHLNEYRRGGEFFDLPDEVVSELLSIKGELGLLEFCGIFA